MISTTPALLDAELQDIDGRRFHAERREDRADLAPVIGAVVQRRCELDAHRDAPLVPVILVDLVENGIRIEVLCQEPRPSGALLRRHRAQQGERRLALGAGWIETDLLLDRDDGRPLHPTNASRAFGKLVREAGVRAIRFHDLRHTAASLMLSAGVNPKVVSERLGHATVGFTLDRYSHLLHGLQEDAAARTAALIYGGG